MGAGCSQLLSDMQAFKVIILMNNLITVWYISTHVRKEIVADMKLIRSVPLY